ncbi:winged helix-turn-helix domain-containing protein [Streptacidiphilus cavernicola]|uniref:Winged helix-turn-helix domain-containing protein n=1 Tax=Streptacidiphilus cavernicola TaxID=3342716 RepID=A0ABV6VRE9_9ACTN
MSNVSQLATPHLRTVTSVLPGPVRPTPPLSLLPTTGAERVLRLPEGAVVTRWPQAAGGGGVPAGLPAEWVAELGAGLGVELGAELGSEVGRSGVPMVGYLVLVPAGPTAAVASPQPPSLRSVTGTASAPASLPASLPAPASAAGGIQLDRERRTARVDGELLELTYLEFELLAHLTANPHRVHTRDHLVTAVWGYGHIGDGRTVDVHVARLRRKLGLRYRAGIVTVRRVGYKYVPPKQG